MPVKYVVITAGGTGTRMGSQIPKQFLEIKGLPVLMHSIKAFLDYSEDLVIILVLPEAEFDTWQSLCKEHSFTFDHILCGGGDTRFQSVKNGLEHVANDGLVAVHDAVRPLVTSKLVERCFADADKNGNAVPVIPVKDSMREVLGEENHPADRNAFRLVQTPQVFDANTLKKAFEQAYRSSFTDEANVVEAMGVKINLVDGEASNIKITTPEDLVVAEELLRC
jgi:2-C-methyl-D-erythritol 4-phosphate cytidylyltransferase